MGLKRVDRRLRLSVWTSGGVVWNALVFKAERLKLFKLYWIEMDMVVQEF